MPPSSRSDGQSRSGGSDEQLAQSSESVEDRSRGPTRDVSPAPSDGSAWPRAPGDSEVSCEEGQAESDQSLLQAEAQGTPLPFAGRRPRDTAPPAVAGEVSQGRRLRSAVLNDREDVGNIGFFFGNWGRRTKQKDGYVQQNIDAQIKKPMRSHWSQ